MDWPVNFVAVIIVAVASGPNNSAVSVSTTGTSQ